MTARKYITDQWDPVSTTLTDRPKVIVRTVILGDTQFRHWLFFLAVLVFLISPILWIATGTWGAALIGVSSAGILFALAALLVPSEVCRINDENDRG